MNHLYTEGSSTSGSGTAHAHMRLRPPSKRHVTLPTIRTLFPNSRHWSKYRSTRLTEKRILHDNTHSYNSKLILNLSKHTLSPQEHHLLSLGLSFVPTPSSTESQTSGAYTTKFTNTLKTQYHFKDSSLRPIHPFHINTSWVPPNPNNKQLTKFISVLHDFNDNLSIEHTGYHNLSPRLRDALNTLKNNHDITIKKCDKGGGICLLDTKDYIKKIHEHLDDTTTYKVMTYDPTPHIAYDVRTLIQYMHTFHYIDDVTKNFLMPHTPPRTPLFYGLPKVHKKDIPLRPIVSGCDSPTDNLSRYITHFIQPLVTHLPSYIKDTKHFLRIIHDTPTLPPDAFLVTADVSSLYTNIPHDEGISAVLHYINTHRQHMPANTPPDYIFEIILRHILDHSFFQFIDTIYHQITGTSMGTRMAPPYANLFMGRVEHKILQFFHTFITIWKRFIDDIFFYFYRHIRTIDPSHQLYERITPHHKIHFWAFTDKYSFSWHAHIYRRKSETPIYTIP